MSPRWPKSEFDLAAFQQGQRAAQCARYGHAFDVTTDSTGRPRQIVCGRCGETWDVA